MTSSVHVTSISKAVRLYGHSNCPSKIRGVFDLAMGSTSIASVPLWEGHVNKSGPQQRFVSATCTLDTWDLDSPATLATGKKILLCRNGSAFWFMPDRITAEVTARIATPAPPRLIRGDGVVVESGLRVGLYEFDAADGRMLYLIGPQESLKAIAYAASSGRCCKIEMVPESEES